MSKPNNGGRAVSRNAIRSALSVTEIELFFPQLNHVTLVSGQALYEPNSPVTDVFFVNEGVVSLTGS